MINASIIASLAKWLTPSQNLETQGPRASWSGSGPSSWAERAPFGP